MGWTVTFMAAAAALLLLLVAGRMHARRGLGRLSLLPWDYLMILSAVLLLMAVLHGVKLWREGWPLPWT